MPHGCKKEIMTLAASICAGYSKAPELTPVEARAATPQGTEIIKVLGIPPKDIRHLLI